MKKAIVILLAALLLLSLAACGKSTPTGDMARPAVSPTVSPEASDGMVTDTDGIIGGADEPNSSASMGGGTANAGATPDVSANP